MRRLDEDVKRWLHDKLEDRSGWQYGFEASLVWYVVVLVALVILVVLVVLVALVQKSRSLYESDISHIEGSVQGSLSTYISLIPNMSFCPPQPPTRHPSLQKLKWFWTLSHPHSAVSRGGVRH